VTWVYVTLHVIVERISIVIVQIIGCDQNPISQPPAENTNPKDEVEATQDESTKPSGQTRS